MLHESLQGNRAEKIAQSSKGLVISSFSLHSKSMRFRGQRNGLIFRLLWSQASCEALHRSHRLGSSRLESAAPVASPTWLQVAGQKGDMGEIRAKRFFY
jgi:hypothetical protein